MSEPWETTTKYGRADLTLDPLVRDAYKVACLIERCGASEQLTAASSVAFNLCISVFDRLMQLAGDSIALQEECERLKHDIERHVAICAEQANEIASLQAWQQSVLAEVHTENEHDESIIKDIEVMMHDSGWWNSALAIGAKRLLGQRQQSALHLAAKLKDAQSCEADAGRYRWLRNNISFHDIDHDFDIEGHNVPVLAQVSNRLWYHATDDVASNTFDEVMDKAIDEYSPQPNSDAQPVDECTTCKGVGSLDEILDGDLIVECPDCAGSGKASMQITPRPSAQPDSKQRGESK